MKKSSYPPPQVGEKNYLPHPPVMCNRPHSFILQPPLDHPLNDTDFPLASNVPISLTFIKANENRLMDHDKTTKQQIAGKRYQITLTSFELHMLQQTICPQLYSAYMSKLLHSPANFFFNRFETTHHSLPNVSYLHEKKISKIRECSKTH